MLNIPLFNSQPDSDFSQLESRWATYRSNSVAMFGLFGLSIIIILALVGLFTSSSPEDAQLIPPAWHDAGVSNHLLGTDLVGRDIFTRLVQGASLTIGTSFISVFAALLIGVGLGILAAYHRGFTLLVIMRSMDIIFAIPSLVLAIIVVSLLGSGLVNAGIAVSIVLMPNFVRTTVKHIEQELQRAYVQAARLDGASPARILLRSIFPNITAPLVLQTTIALSTAIVEIALLGFLGLGAQSPSPEWGTMLFEARTSMHIAPWAVTMPGIAILFSVLCINFIGDGLSRVIRQRKY